MKKIAIDNGGVNSQLSIINSPLKKGYKKTEVGEVPEDWEVIDLGKYLKGIPKYGINAPAISFDSSFPTYIRITDISDDGKFTEATKASVKHPAAMSYVLESGDIVFARTGASVGKSYLYNKKDGLLVFAGFLIRIRPDPERIVPAYIWLYAQSRPYWNWVKTNSMRSGQPGINGREYASINLPIPSSLTEQSAIATSLSDADSLIESLEQLIDKKRKIKQGAMQELLTGKRRLAGFGGKWEVKPLGDLFDVTAGGDLEKNKFSSSNTPDYPFPIYANSVYNTGLYGYSSSFIDGGNSITITARGTLGVAFYRDHNFTAIGRLIVLTPKVSVDVF